MKLPGTIAVVALPIVCCAGLPVRAAGIGAGLAVWIGGIAGAGMVLAAAGVFGLRMHRRRGQSSLLPAGKSRP